MADRSLNTIDTEDKAADPQRVGGICLRMAEATQDLHRLAERTGIVSDLIRRKATVPGYALFLRNLAPAYRAMEAGLRRHRNMPGLNAFSAAHLFRSDAIENDLVAIMGADWATALPRLPAGIEYAERIDWVAANEPYRLTGHAYVRYFGDLSGGQILRKLIAETLSLPPTALAFYEFAGMDNTHGFKEAVRKLLDLEFIDPEICDAIADETSEAFRLNIRLSEEVQQHSARD